MRVGGSETIKIDIRLVAATNQDLEAAVEENRFRRDLYYRLKVVTLSIPPLRDRREDIPLLAKHFLDQFRQESGRESLRFTPDTMRCLVDTSWEGNVRELRNLVESLVVLVPHDEIRVEDLPVEYSQRQPESERVGPAGLPAPQDTPQAVTMEEIERRAILEALERSGGNRTQAAEALGIGLRTLQRKLKEYRLAGKDEGR
jgi:DNA-binding NtrC family response regulator